MWVFKVLPSLDEKIEQGNIKGFLGEMIWRESMKSFLRAATLFVLSLTIYMVSRTLPISYLMY